MKEWGKRHRRTIVLVLIGMIIGLLYGCWYEQDKYGRTPREAVMAYERAIGERDGVTLNQVATMEQAQRVSEGLGLALFQRKERSITGLNYLMKEYPLDSEEYWYEVHWFLPGSSGWSKCYRVVDQNGTWKVEEIDPEEFQRFTHDIKPSMLRGQVHD